MAAVICLLGHPSPGIQGAASIKTGPGHIGKPLKIRFESFHPWMQRGYLRARIHLHIMSVLLLARAPVYTATSECLKSSGFVDSCAAGRDPGSQRTTSSTSRGGLCSKSSCHGHRRSCRSRTSSLRGFCLKTVLTAKFATTTSRMWQHYSAVALAEFQALATFDARYCNNSS